jgi:hypothetical protein
MIRSFHIRASSWSKLDQVSVVHTGPKANTNKTQTSRFTWFPKTGYVHGGSRLYINGGMIQTLNSTQYNPTKPSVSLLHSFLSNLHFLPSLTVALSSSLCTHLHCLYAFSLVSLFCLFFFVYRRKENINIMAAKDRVVDGGEGG